MEKKSEKNTFWTLMFVCAFCIPLVALLVSCMFMYYVNRQQAHFTKDQPGVNNVRHKKILWKLVVLIFTFAICTGFQHAFFVVNTFTALTISRRKLFWLYGASNLVVSLQAAINPFIYDDIWNKFCRACSFAIQYLQPSAKPKDRSQTETEDYPLSSVCVTSPTLPFTENRLHSHCQALKGVDDSTFALGLCKYTLPSPLALGIDFPLNNDNPSSNTSSLR